jgi:putative membrane protein
MSDLNDPRVLFAAERTLMAWSRTAAGLMAFGFLIDRSELLLGEGGARPVGMWIGIAFILMGVALCALSVVQYRRAIADLRPVEIPKGYWVNLSVAASGVIGLLGAVLAIYLAAG